MRRWVEVKEICINAQMERLVPKEQGASQDKEADTKAVTEEEVEILLS